MLLILLAGKVHPCFGKPICCSSALPNCRPSTPHFQHLSSYSFELMPWDGAFLRPLSSWAGHLLIMRLAATAVTCPFARSFSVADPAVSHSWDSSSDGDSPPLSSSCANKLHKCCWINTRINNTRCKLVLQANKFLFQSMCGHISILLERNPWHPLVQSLTAIADLSWAWTRRTLPTSKPCGT